MNSINLSGHKRWENGHATQNGERGCVDRKIWRRIEVLGVEKDEKKAVYDGRWRTINGVTGDGDGINGASWRLKIIITKNIYIEKTARIQAKLWEQGEHTMENTESYK